MKNRQSRALVLTRRCLQSLFLGLLLPNLVGQPPTEKSFGERARIEPEFEIASLELARMTANGPRSLVIIGKEGEIRTWLPTAAKPLERPSGNGRIDEASRSLFAFGALDGGADHLLVYGPDGVKALAPTATGTFEPAFRSIQKRPRPPVRAGMPTMAPIARDLDRDGRSELVLLAGEALQLWKSTANGSEAQWQRTATVPIDVDRNWSVQAERLSDLFVCETEVQDLLLRDCNGDGRDDLVLQSRRERKYFLQRKDGTFAETPDVTVNLELFRDTTPEASVKPGRTLAGSDRTRMQERDLDQDGIPDAVIAHRRKVWVYPASKTGPQFEMPSAILKTADDLTALFVARLDNDQRPDLLLLRVQVPTVATLVLGMLGDWEVELTALGYENQDGRTFAATPKWKREITFTLPSIAGVLRDPEALIKRLESVGRNVARRLEADFNGDGRTDLALLPPGSTHLAIWYGTGKSPGDDAYASIDQAVREFLFEGEKKDWTLESFLVWLDAVIEQQTSKSTGNRKADLVVPIDGLKERRPTSLLANDFDGDGMAEIVMELLTDQAERQSRILILGWK